MSDRGASNFKDGDKFTFDCPCCGEVHEGVGGQIAELQCDPKDTGQLIEALKLIRKATDKIQDIVNKG